VLCFVTVKATSNALITEEKMYLWGDDIHIQHDLDVHILTHGTPTSKQDSHKV